MSIIGIGVDVVEIARVENACARHEKFIEKILTETECFALPKGGQGAYIAGRFAVKEAVSKALGCGIGKIDWQDIETTNDMLGAPVVALRKRAKALADEKGIKKIHCSISHEKTVAVAMIILEG